MFSDLDRFVPCADEQGVKALLTVIVYIALVATLALVSLFTQKPQPGDGFDDDL